MSNLYQSIVNAYDNITQIFDRMDDNFINNINIGNNINVTYNGNINTFPDILDDFDLNISPITTLGLEIIVDYNINKTEIECCVCMENKKDNDICLLSCQHIFCVSCIKKTILIKKFCPLCRRNINKVFVTIEENREKLMEAHHP